MQYFSSSFFSNIDTNCCFFCYCFGCLCYSRTVSFFCVSPRDEFDFFLSSLYSKKFHFKSVISCCCHLILVIYIINISHLFVHSYSYPCVWSRASLCRCSSLSQPCVSERAKARARACLPASQRTLHFSRTERTRERALSFARYFKRQ